MEVACSGCINKILPCQQIDASPPWTPHQNPKLCSSQYLEFLQTSYEWWKKTQLWYIIHFLSYIYLMPNPLVFDHHLYTLWFNKYKLGEQQIQTWWFNKYRLGDSTNTKLIISVSPSWQRRPSVWLKICNANLDFLCPGLRRWGWWWRKMEPFWHPTENLQCFSSVAWSPNLNKEEQISQKYVQSEFVWIQVLLSWVFSGSHFEDSTEWG